MDAGTQTQLITVAATLGGVVLTLVANAFLERRRAWDSRELESLRLKSDHERWLREERVRAYAALSTTGEEILHFVRSELPVFVEPGGGQREPAEARWRVLRTDLRKAYNQVALFGGEEVRVVAQDFWRTTRNAVNDIVRDVSPYAGGAAAPPDLVEQILSRASRIGTAGERLLDACRKDLQGP
jgi:hypothetical protein